MPFASVYRPSIGVSLLKSGLQNNGFSSKIHYFNLDFADLIGLDKYDDISEKGGGISLIGEIVFANYAFNQKIKKEDLKVLLGRFFNQYNNPFFDRIMENMVNVQTYVEDFIDRSVLEILKENPKIVGFTSMFHQNCASISMAKKLKEYSDIPVVFGGANCEGEMGATLLKRVPWIDYICSGEGDIAFIEFIKSFLNSKSLGKINGIITRQSTEFEVAMSSPVMRMDDLPFPNFTDYFQTLQRTTLRGRINPRLVIETSRGCWWGEKSHCTFCGLNGSTMTFRSKTTKRALEEFKYLSKTYGVNRFAAVDNILDLNYINELFPEFYRERLDISVFYETKSNIKREQLQILKKGGLDMIQPGIESLSDDVLRLMKKGVSSLQNIQLLKWCREIDIDVNWNFIWGFPNEPLSEYKKMASILPMLFHLEPPGGYDQIVIDRFSPYYIDPSKYGIVNIKPALAYKYIYPFNEKDLQKIAYHFDFDYLDKRVPSSYTKELSNEIDRWKQLWKENNIPTLVMTEINGMIMINDTRPCAVQPLHILIDDIAEVFKTCTSIQNLSSIQTRMQRMHKTISEDRMVKLLTNLLESKLMLKDEGRYLSLPISIGKTSNLTNPELQSPFKIIAS